MQDLYDHLKALDLEDEYIVMLQSGMKKDMIEEKEIAQESKPKIHKPRSDSTLDSKALPDRPRTDSSGEFENEILPGLPLTPYNSNMFQKIVYTYAKYSYEAQKEGSIVL